jgi:hypothetical protein
MPSPKTQTNTPKGFPKVTPAGNIGKSPSMLIDERISGLPDWRGDILTRLRAVIRRSDPQVTEEWKWNVPVWSCHGIICTGETYKKAVKLTFAKGAALPDPSGLFNASLEGNVRRAIDFPQGATVDEAALSDLVRAAVSHNKTPPAGKSISANLRPPVEHKR